MLTGCYSIYIFKASFYFVLYVGSTLGASSCLVDEVVHILFSFSCEIITPGLLPQKPSFVEDAPCLLLQLQGT